MHDVAVLLVCGLGHESGFVTVRVELLGLAVNGLCRVETLQAVLQQRVHEDVLGHLEALVKVLQVLVGLGLVGGELVGGDDGEGTVKVVDRLEQVDGEFLNGECSSALHVALGALLEVSKVGDRPEVFVLFN